MEIAILSIFGLLALIIIVLRIRTMVQGIDGNKATESCKACGNRCNSDCIKKD